MGCAAALWFLQAIGLLHLVSAALVWNTKGEAGIFVSIAIPIDVHRRHVFLSYNFEANYRLPRTWRKEPSILRGGNATHLDSNEDAVSNEDSANSEQLHHKKRKKPKPHKKKHKSKPKPKPTPPAEEDYKDFFEGISRNQHEIARTRRREQETLLSRTKFYEILSRRFEQHGLGSGDSCLLRLICEANNAQLGEHNGVLGSLMHVMFSPGSSRYEALPRRYYQAERDGVQGKCWAYLRQCERSVLEMITRPLADYIGNKNA